MAHGLAIPLHSLVLGNPGKVVRSLTPEEVASLHRSANHSIICHAVFDAADHT